MATLFEYLKWRGDLTFSQAPFNDVDNLIFSELSYIEFDDLVNNKKLKQSKLITIEHAARYYFSVHDESEISKKTPFYRANIELFKAISQQNRYKDLNLTHFTNVLDEENEKQFSAITIILDDKSIFIAYRGTDDSFVGWKEDFNMSFMKLVPSHGEALEYLQRVAKDFPYAKIRLGGHSKGGNLAVYAAVHCSSRIQSRIINAFSNDGPGFQAEVSNTPEYQGMIEKIRTIIPQTSIIGMLLQHEEPYTIIKSKQTGIMQHDTFSWEVMGANFVKLDEVTTSCRFIDHTLKSWLEEMDKKDLENFVKALYEILQGTEANNFAEIANGGLKSIRLIFKAIKESNEDTKKIMSHTFKSLFRVARSTWPMLKNGLVILMILAITLNPVDCFAKAKRTLRWPVPAVKGISSCYGDGRNHKAIDIYAKKGAKVVAVQAGKVVKIKKKCKHNYAKSKYCCGDGYGKWVKIKHKKKIKRKTVYSKYNHLTSINVKKGQKVKTGKKIGTVGATGYSAASHLDFQIMIKNKYVDPGKFLILPKGLYYSGGRYKKCCAKYIKKLKKSMK